MVNTRAVHFSIILVPINTTEWNVTIQYSEPSSEMIIAFPSVTIYYQPQWLDLGGTSFPTFIGQSLRIYEYRIWNNISLSPIELRSFTAIGTEKDLLHLWKMETVNNDNTISDICKPGNTPLNAFGATDDSIFTTQNLMNTFQYTSFPEIDKFQRNSSFATVSFNIQI